MTTNQPYSQCISRRRMAMSSGLPLILLLLMSTPTAQAFSVVPVKGFDRSPMVSSSTDGWSVAKPDTRTTTANALSATLNCVEEDCVAQPPRATLLPMPLVATGLACFLTTLTACSPPVWAEDASSSSPPQLTHGAALFTAQCAGCHGSNGVNFVKPSKTLQRDALDKYLGSTDPGKVQDFVQNGMPHRMLPFKKEWSDQEYADVVSYVVDQAVGNKWE